MQKFVLAEALEDEMRLEQMGGEVDQVNGKLCFVRFHIDGIDVEYAYNINTKGEFFLERIKPYPLPLKTYEDESKIIDIIDVDLEQFRQAVRSHNVSTFIDLGMKFHYTTKRFEDLFLYYNVPKETIEEINDALDAVNEIIDECQRTATRLYFKKEPDNL